MQVLSPSTTEHAVQRSLARLFIGVCYPDVPDDAPLVARRRLSARRGRAFLDRVPVAGHIDCVESKAHGDVAALADYLQGIGSWAGPSDSDGRVRLLEGGQERLERGVLVLGRVRYVYVPELPLVLEWPFNMLP